MVCPIGFEGVTDWREPIACVFLPKKEKKKRIYWKSETRSGAERRNSPAPGPVLIPEAKRRSKNNKRTNICLQAPNEQVLLSAGGPETIRADGECFFFFLLDRWSSPPSAALCSASAFCQMRWWCPSFRAGSVNRGNCLFHGPCV